MFQTFKRTKFLQNNNYTHWNAGDIVRMYAWLMQHQWPADKLVDLFMRCHLNFNQTMDGVAFKHFMFDQFEYVHGEDNEALKRLYKTIDCSRYRDVDKEGIVGWIGIIHQGILGAEEEIQLATEAEAELMALWNDNQPKTKALIIRRLTSMLETEIKTRDVNQLKNLKVALREDFNLYFNTEIKYRSAVWAIYSFSDSEYLEAICGFKWLKGAATTDESTAVGLISPVIDQLALEISRSFERDSPQYAMLETGDLYL